MTQTPDHRCPRCGTPLKTVTVQVPVSVDAQDAPVTITKYVDREEVADCVRCTGAY